MLTAFPLFSLQSMFTTIFFWPSSRAARSLSPHQVGTIKYVLNMLMLCFVHSLHYDNLTVLSWTAQFLLMLYNAYEHVFTRSGQKLLLKFILFDEKEILCLHEMVLYVFYCPLDSVGPLQFQGGSATKPGKPKVKRKCSSRQKFDVSFHSDSHTYRSWLCSSWQHVFLISHKVQIKPK